MLHALIVALLIILLAVPVALLLKPVEMAERWKLPIAGVTSVRLLAVIALILIAFLGVVALNVI
jgi:hypothetical protein